MARGYNTRLKKATAARRAANMAQIDRVAQALQRALTTENRTAGHFAQRMEAYARDAKYDNALYAWLDARGVLPPPGEEIPSAYIAAFNSEHGTSARIRTSTRRASRSACGSVQS